MRVQGKKRKGPHAPHGRSVEKRSKDDIISSHQPEIRSYLSREELQALSKYGENAIKPTVVSAITNSQVRMHLRGIIV